MATFTWNAPTDNEPWTTAGNWAVTGVDADGLPDSDDDVVFDGTSTKTSSLDAATSIHSLTIAAAYTGTITQAAAANLTLGGDYSQSGGTFVSAAAVDVGGGVNLSSGAFTAPPAGASFSVGGNVALSGGTFTANTGVLTLTSTATQTLSTGGATLYSLGHAAAGAVQLGGNLSLTSTLTQSSGSFDLASYDLSLATLIVSGGTLKDSTTSTSDVTATSAYDLRGGEVSVPLIGAIGLNKTTASTATLSGVNLYTGATDVQVGTLQVDGSTASTSTVTVRSGATLAGGGNVAGSVTVAAGGNVAPGASAGVLTTGSIAFAAGSTFTVELGGTTAGVGAGFHDQLVVPAAGTIDLGGATLAASLIGGFTPNASTLQAMTIIDNQGASDVTGQFASLPEGSQISLGGGNYVYITYRGGDGNDVQLNSQPVFH
ncbi:MAG TPA: hypothetical protein PLV92_09185, partial [Pirellulaceae bacterium]|nr:hypothetical protein [Pirellulaceae bacterium]